MSDRIGFRVIPAEPGWLLLEGCVGEEGSVPVCLSRMPVIAWLVEGYARGDDVYWDITPLTVEGEASRESDWALRSPTGQLCIPTDKEFASEEDLLRYFRELAQESADAQAAKRARAEAMEAGK